MATNYTHRTPLKPGQRVAVFPDDAASGATIGYYGTVIYSDSESIQQGPDCPDAWRYRVATFAGHINVEGRDILPLGRYRSFPRRQGFWRKHRLTFDSPLEDDNDVIGGYCRSAGKILGYFQFRKEPQQLPSYQLILATQLPGMPWGIKFRVPSDCCLNEHYVMRALAEILGGETPTETEPCD